MLWIQIIVFFCSGSGLTFNFCSRSRLFITYIFLTSTFPFFVSRSSYTIIEIHFKQTKVIKNETIVKGIINLQCKVSSKDGNMTFLQSVWIRSLDYFRIRILFSANNFGSGWIRSGSTAWVKNVQNLKNYLVNTA